MRYRAAILLLSALALPQLAQAQKQSRDRITREEIDNSAQKDADLYQVVRALRPHFLEPPKGVRSMGNSDVAAVALFIEKRQESGLESLKLIVPSTVEEIRYLSPSQAQNEYGNRANSGAVVVKLRKQEKKEKKDSTTTK